MKKLIYKDKKSRHSISNLNYFIFILKNIVRNKNICFSIRFNANLKLALLAKNASKVRCLNRCVFTGRKSSINRKFRMSRIKLLKICRFGKIPGIKKMVW